MPKMKTKSGAKKRFRVSSSGKVKVKQSHMRHMQMNKPKSMKRDAKGQTHLCDADAKVILDNFLPYSRPKKSRPKKGPEAKAAASSAKKGA